MMSHLRLAVEGRISVDDELMEIDASLCGEIHWLGCIR